LTGAVHQYYGERLLAEEVERARRYRRTFSLAYFEPVDWAAVQARRRPNEVEGLLREAGDRFLRRVRVMDKVVRFNDDAQFAVILPETGVAAAEAIGRRLLEQVGEAVGVDMRVGIAEFPRDAGTVRDLLREARAAARFAGMAQEPVASQGRED
jgi:GGDEF domain-containing protein